MIFFLQLDSVEKWKKKKLRKRGEQMLKDFPPHFPWNNKLNFFF